MIDARKNLQNPRLNITFDPVIVNYSISLNRKCKQMLIFDTTIETKTKLYLTNGRKSR